MMLTWAEAASAGPLVAGGKGHNLGRLARYGFRIPDGGVLAADAYRLAMRDDGKRAAIEAGESAELPDPVRGAVRKFVEERQWGDTPLAVRSSATAEDSARASFAGIHRSALNVRGIEAIERAIGECYASLWTPQALAYRRRMGFADGDVACAVVICRMVAGEGSTEPLCAGVAFSADPQSGLRDRIVIDAVAGLGDAAVSGRVTPRRYMVRVHAARLMMEESGGYAPFAAETQLRELASTVYRIHWALGDGQDPQDIEWAHDGKQLWIVQSRPITALPRAGPKALVSLPRYWSRGNLKDSSPGVPCELSWSTLQELVFVVAFASVGISGYRLDPGLELVRRFRGRVYFDFTLIQWAMFDAFGVAPELTIRLIGGHQPLIQVPAGDPLKGAVGKRRRKAALKLAWTLWGFEKRSAPKLQQFIDEMRSLASQPMESSSRSDLLAMVSRVEANPLQPGMLAGLANACSGKWMTPLEELLQRTMGARGAAVVSALSAGSNEITSAEQGYRMYDLARTAQGDPEAREWLQSAADLRGWTDLPSGSAFRREFQRFLEDFGHRASIETDAWNPRWAEDPSSLIELVREHLAAGIASDPRVAARKRRAEAEREVRARHPLLWPVIRWLARKLRRAWAVRELGKSALVAAVMPYRRIVLEVGRRLAAGGQLDDARQALDLTTSDVRGWLEGFWDGRGARELAADRRRSREAWLGEDAPEVIAGEGAADFTETAAPPAVEGEWQGTPVSSGRRSGIARIISSPYSGGKLAPGEILVAAATDPGWTPLFVRASAVVMESGGYLSHGAIVAREFGLPAVVNIPGIMRQLQDGETIVVNGDEGTVSRLK